MASEEHQVGLYDFLYRDSHRIDSYYAQIFGGKLTSSEQASTEEDGTTRATEINAQIARMEFHTSGSVGRQSRRTIDPHDVIVTDALSWFSDNNAYYTDVDAAPHGSLISVKGTLILTDSSLLGMAEVFFDEAIRQERCKPKKQRDENAISGMKILKGVLSKMDVPSSFLLKSESGKEIAGIIKDTGMEEPISSYYFKHGAAGISDVYLVGIKEKTAEESVSPSHTDFMAGIQQAAHEMRDLLFHPQATRVTPLALFRQLDTISK